MIKKIDAHPNTTMVIDKVWIGSYLSANLLKHFLISNGKSPSSVGDFCCLALF